MDFLFCSWSIYFLGRVAVPLWSRCFSAFALIWNPSGSGKWSRGAQQLWELSGGCAEAQGCGTEGIIQAERSVGEQWRENLWPWEMCVLLREKPSLKMGLLIFPEHTGNAGICVGAVVTVKMAIYYILFSLQKFLNNCLKLQIYKILGKVGCFHEFVLIKDKAPNCSKPFLGEIQMLLGVIIYTKGFWLPLNSWDYLIFCVEKFYLSCFRVLCTILGPFVLI